MLNDILDFVSIMSIDDYNLLLSKIEKLEDQFAISIKSLYYIGNKDYLVVEFEVIPYFLSPTLAVNYLLKYLNFICLRLEYSPYVFCKKEGDIIDLIYDAYDGNTEEDFKKDLLSTAERYEILFDLCDEIKGSSELFLEQPDILNMELCHIPLDETTEELFVEKSILSIYNKKTDTVSTIDITKGVPYNFFKLIFVKKLDKKQ